MADFTLLPDEPPDLPDTPAAQPVQLDAQVTPPDSSSVTQGEPPVKPKNKGGRPRKHPIVIKDPNAPKNKGGRPRKNPLPPPTEEPDELDALSKRALVPSGANPENVLGSDADMLIKLLESGDDGGAHDLLMRRLMQSSIRLIAKVEQGVAESNGRFGVHSFNGLVMSIRELINDIQAARDRGAIGQVLVEQVIRPAFMDVGMAIMQEFFKANQDAKNMLREHDYKEIERIQKECRDRIGQHLNKSYENMRDGIINYLQR